MELIYIIGKRNGTPRQAFTEAEMQLRKMGFVAINPLEEILKFNEIDEDGLNSPEEETRFLEPFLAKCTGIYLLRGWEDCNTAKTEQEIAISLGLRAMFQPQRVSVDEIIKAAEEVTGMNMQQLRQRCRKAGLVEVRRAIFYLACRYQSATLVGLAQMFGMDHTTVLNSRNRAEALLQVNDERTTDIINQIKNKLTA